MSWTSCEKPYHGPQPISRDPVSTWRATCDNMKVNKWQHVSTWQRRGSSISMSRGAAIYGPWRERGKSVEEGAPFSNWTVIFLRQLCRGLWTGLLSHAWTPLTSANLCQIIGSPSISHVKCSKNTFACHFHICEVFQKQMVILYRSFCIPLLPPIKWDHVLTCCHG